MAYSNYGAFVYRNGERRKDKEDAPLFATSEEINNIPSGLRIFANIFHTKGKLDFDPVRDYIAHGVLGDGPVRVQCYKQGVPDIYELMDTGEICRVPFPYDDPFEYGTIEFNHKGYEFIFTEGTPYFAFMREPDGTEWVCEYDYEFGAGFENEDES